MIYLLGFIFGLCIGSFLNVVIYRLPITLDEHWTALCSEYLKIKHQKSKFFNLAFPLSHCPGCKNPIKFYHNIPLISFLFLKARCSYCKERISWLYPLVELITGLLTAFVIYHFGVSLQALFGAVFCCSMIALIVIDLQTQLLPDNITLPLLWLGLLLNTQNMFCNINDAVIGAAFGYLFLWSFIKLFYLVTGKEGMGEGDFKLFSSLGAWFGWQLLPLIIILSSLLGAVIGTNILLIKKQNKDTLLPFGPYLGTMGIVTLFWGNSLIDWYLSLFA